MKKLLTLLLLSLLTFSLAAAQDDGADIDLTPPELGDYDPDSIADIDLTDYPVLPVLTDHARVIYQRGQANGRDAHVFSKVGDCMTWSENFLTAFDGGDYDLGDYDDLQPVIDYFAEGLVEDTGLSAFSSRSLAAESGFTTISILDSTWSDPDRCSSNESPLACEYRAANSAFSLIMFGTNDVFYFDALTFDYYLRLVVLETINTDIVPVMYTFPVRPEFPEKTEEFNRIIVKIALDYDLPLVNLVLALEDLPDQGVDIDEPIHLSLPEGVSASVFSEDNLQAGYTLRNLLTLQALQILTESLEALPTDST